jgi:tetratricopeptide (TPR) repeat protein
VVFHTTNLLLHLLNTVLVYFFVNRLFANKTMAILTMLLFGLHSIHAESVAWVTERKDLLYSLFYLAALNFYLEFISKQKNKFYPLVVLAFLCSLLSKAMAVSFPFIMLLIDFYKKRDLLNKKMILEKIPFFLIAAIWGLLTLYWHNQHGSLNNATGFAFAERIVLGAKGLGFYISHIVVPINLAAFHPLPDSFSRGIFLEGLFYVLGFIGLFIWILIKRKKYRIVFFGSGFFFFSLFIFLIPPGVPVIASERYAYIGSIGIFILISYGFDFLQTKFVRVKFPLQILMAAYLIFLGINTFRMARTWENSLALWNRVIKIHGEIFYPLQQRGIANRLVKNYPAALEDFSDAIQLNSYNYRSFEQRGYVYSLMGNYGNAQQDFKKALELEPESHIAWANLGFIYRITAEHSKALDCFNKAIAINKDYVDAYINRAKLHFKMDSTQKACADLYLTRTFIQTTVQRQEIDRLIKQYHCKSLESRTRPGQ